MGKVVARPETGRLYLDFRLNGVRCRESLSLEDNAKNRKTAEKLLAQIEEQITLGTFDYRATFPNSKRAVQFPSPQTGRPPGSAAAVVTPPPVVEAPTRVVGEGVLTPLSLWDLEGQPYRKTGDVDNYSLNTRESATVGGVTYEDVIRVHSVNNRRSITYWFNLDVGRERLKGKAAIEDVGESEVQLSAYDSGEEVFSQTFYPGALPQAFDFDISGISILQLKFESGYAGGARLVLMSP